MWNSRLFWRRCGIFAGFSLIILFGAELLRQRLAPFYIAPTLVLGCIFLFVLLASAIAAWIGARAIRRPLRKLAEATEAITQGGYHQRVYLEPSDEFGQLGAAFNAMSQALEKEIAQIDRDRQELRAVFRCMVEGVIVIDADQNVQLLNEAASRLLKLPPEASKGRRLWELVRSRDLVEAAEAVLRSDTPLRREVEWNVREQKALAVQGSNLVGPPLRGAVLVLQDISELRRLERMRQDFVANVSHELKTPLAAIQAGVETLLDGALHDPGHNVRFLERVRENAIRLDLLVQDLLALNRIESGQEQLEIQPVQLADSAAACLARHEDRAKAKSLQLRLESPPDPVAALADEDALEHILDNLLDNAIKYTPAGGSVTIRCFAAAGHANLQVIDTGVGIPEKDLARVFERFYRVDKARSRELGGTGLGLSIVKHLVQALAGQVRAESKPDHGTTFTICLPAA